MSVASGERLGPYELVSRIGAGGMGEVWRARDTRLGRDVAVKILPAEFAEDAQLQIRFQREARAISRLNHPHICTLYDVGENYLVMELLDGESLEIRCDRGPMPLDEVLRYGAEIAEALDRAHKAGIVHRDLKPGNVMITKSGAKLLDFGLAKSTESAVRTDSVTAQKRLTEEGIVVGTFQYMAPEQVEGAEVDTRTDIFALGDVLYEMTTGRPAFEGKSRMSLMAAILSGQPTPVSQLQPLTPPALEHVIAKCLSKNPEERWQSAHDVAGQLRWIGSAQPAVPAGRPKSRERLLWIAALIALAAAATWLALRPGPREEAIEAAIATEGNDGLGPLTGPPAFSPDGRFLAYAARDASGRVRLQLGSMDDGSSRAIEGTDEAYTPLWSPDGRFIVFGTARGPLRKIAVAGGKAETIVARQSVGYGWNRDGVILFGEMWGGSPIYRVSAAGGREAEVLNPAAIGATNLNWSTFLPDGNHFLFYASGGVLEQRGQDGMWVGTLDRSEPPRFIARSTGNAVYVKSGHLLFLRDAILYAQKFDAGTLRITGDAAPIAPVQAYGVIGLFAVSNNGLLVYQRPTVAARTELLLKNRKGEVIARAGNAAFHWSPRFSRDGLRIAVDRSDEKNSGDIWVLDLDGGVTQVSSDPSNETAPVWSPRGDEIAYMKNVPGANDVLRTRIGGSPARVMPTSAEGYLPTDWSPDGRHLAIERTGSGNFDAVVWSLAERTWIAVAATAAHEGRAVFSPDGKWLAYHSDESGRHEIYVQSFPRAGPKYQVSEEGGMTPRWPRPGEIVWAGLDNRLHAAKVETTPAFRAGRAEALFTIEQQSLNRSDFDVAPNGNFLVKVPLPAPPQPMTLLVNWERRISRAR